LIESKFSNSGWNLNAADSLDALGLTESKFSDGGGRYSLDALDLTVGKFSNDG